MKISLIADQAIGEAGTRSADGLGFETYSRILAAAASDTRGPFTIGVFGEWGTGKTSLMRLIERRLSDNPDIVTVWFNAWRYEKEEHPIVPLVGTIVQALERQPKLPQHFGAAGRKLIRALRAIAYGFSAKATVKVPGFAEVEASFVAKDMIDRDERLTSDPLLDRSLYYGAFNSLDEVRLRENVRVVVLIDDLDRCFPDQAIRLLESIKLVLAQPGFIFIIGVARQVLEGYLQHRYRSEYGIADFQGQLYLDKIVQLPFHIPPSTGRMARFYETLLVGQPDDLVEELQPILPVCAEALGGNPRAVIRFVNNILIDYAISTDLPEFSSAGPIPVRFFAVSRCLEHRWPDVFTSLAASDELAEHIATWSPDDYAEHATEVGPEAMVAARLLADPSLRRLLDSRHGRDWLGDPVLRQASVSFLIRQQRLSPPDSSEVDTVPNALISYLLEDRAGALQIVQILSEAGIKVSLGTDVRPGERWVQALNRRGYAAALLFCVGAHSDESGTQAEEFMAMSRFEDALIIPILMPGSDPLHIPNFLLDRGVVDLRDGITIERLHPLVNILRSPYKR